MNADDERDRDAERIAKRERALERAAELQPRVALESLEDVVMRPKKREET